MGLDLYQALQLTTRGQKQPVVLKETEKLYDTSGRDITSVHLCQYILELDKRIYELEKKQNEHQE